MNTKFLFSIVFLFAFTAIQAQWNHDVSKNLLVADPVDGRSFPVMSQEGKTYIPYWKKVDAPINYELWLQILDKEGNKELGEEGVMLSDQVPILNTYGPVIEAAVVDSSNHLYIAVSGSLSVGSPGYIFRVSPQGTMLWSVNLGEASFPTLLSLSNGDLLVSYWPRSKKYARIERFDVAGNRVWDSPKIVVSDQEESETVPANLFELPNNQFTIIFHKWVEPMTILFAQKYNFNGNKLWEFPKQISTKQTHWYGERHSGVVDGDVIYYGYSASNNNFFNSYLQRINPDSSLPWGVDGMDFDTRQECDELDMKIAFTPGSSHIWAISKYGFSIVSAGEYVQKFDKHTGERLFTDNAKEVFPIDSQNQRYHWGNLHLVDNKPFFIIQRIITPSMVENIISLNAVLLRENGDFALPEIPMATFPAEKSYINTFKPIDGQSVIVFQEKKSIDANTKIYAQNLILPSQNMTSKTKTSINTEVFPSLSPNPAKEEFSIINISNLKEDLGNVQVEIYDVSGKLVLEQESKEKVSVRDLSNGTYMVKLTINGKIYTKKLIVQR